MTSVFNLRRACTALIATSLAVVAGASMWPAPRARACGGCFATFQSASGGTASVVTAHRMALSMSPTQTTLWDQFAFAGDPEDFVWVLPTSPEARVELADNRFFEALESRTNVSLIPNLRPVQTSCPTSPGCGFRAGAPSFADASAARDSSSAPPPPPPVMVHHEGTVGPYETATVSSDDPMALLTWLQERGYGVPDALLPTIRYYGEMGLAFVALRLSPDEGVQRMQPVRVTVPGLSYVLPLRMIAAGVADKVGLRLFVFADDRYGAQNFPNAEVRQEQVTYDWRTATMDYDALFAAALASNDGRTWVTSYAGSLPFTRGTPFYDADGPYDLDDDLGVALEGLDTPTLTRLEASLGVNALDRDLLLSLSEAPESLSQFLYVTREINRPADVVCAPTPPTSCPSGAPGEADVAGGSSVCAVAAPGVGSTGRASGGAALALVAMACLARWRARRSAARPRHRHGS